MIPFNKPPFTGHEERYVLEAINGLKMAGDGTFTQKCHQWFEDRLCCPKALLTTSCTHALEMTAILIDIQPGDEVIMPSFTFTSTANAFALRGAKIVFVDVRPDTMNIDETIIEAVITKKTKAIVPIHYAGVSCEMDEIMAIAERHNLYVIEDAAQGMMSSYKGKALGTIGHLGTFSFHETKNYTSGGEGGLLIINDEKFIDGAEIIREKGTNRSKFFRGMVDKYSWVDLGSSYLPNELTAAYLWGQLESAEEINQERRASWQRYFDGLTALKEMKFIETPHLPSECQLNGHMFFLKVRNHDERTALLEYLGKKAIGAAFHYVPLHEAPAGKRFGKFFGIDQFTTSGSDRLIRLPMFFGITDKEIDLVISSLFSFFKSDRSD